MKYEAPEWELQWGMCERNTVNHTLQVVKKSRREIEWFMQYYWESFRVEHKAVNTQVCDYFLENYAFQIKRNYASHKPMSYQDP